MLCSKNRAGAPIYRDDLYSRHAIVDPYPHYARLRRLGPVVWLAKQRAFALPGFEECKTVLRDDKRFISGRGVALNPLANRLSRGTTLNSDGADHDHRRKLVAHRLLPRALRAMTADVESQADRIVASAVEQRDVDGVTDLARALPLSVVPDFVGWPKDGREHLLRWGAATFDFLGPSNRFTVKSLPASAQMLRYSKRVVRDRSVIEGSMGDDILVASDDGKIAMRACSALMIDYLVPSLDTTISGIASALALFAMHPDQWCLLRREPALLPGAINEVLRFESPLRAFSRKVAAPCEIGGVQLPAGSRVLVLFASANRDERQWQDPESFDVRRDANRQLAFGNGAHACAGQGLARLEMAAMLTALVARVERIELAGEPTWALNNIIRCYEHLPLRLISA